MKLLEKVQSIVANLQAVNDEPIAISGLSETDILQAFRRINLSPPSNLVEFYQWYNGIEHLDAFLRFLPLNDAIAIYKSYEPLKTIDPSAFSGGRNGSRFYKLIATCKYVSISRRWRCIRSIWNMNKLSKNTDVAIAIWMLCYTYFKMAGMISTEKLGELKFFQMCGTI